MKALTSKGHLITKWENSTSLKEILLLTYKLSAFDQAKLASEAVQKEPPTPAIAGVLSRASKSQSQIKKLKAKFGKDRLAYFIYGEVSGEEHTVDLTKRKNIQN